MQHLRLYFAPLRGCLAAGRGGARASWVPSTSWRSAYYLIARGHLYLQIGPQLVVGVAGLLLCLAYGVALGLWTSVIYPRARDIRYVVGYGLQFWMFLTPVFYSIQSLPHAFQILAQMNPLTPILGLVQYGFLDAGGLRLYGLVWSIVCILLTAVFGLMFFNRFASKFVGMADIADDEQSEEDDLI